MKSLDILDPQLDLESKIFVEASAGCGKTFAIENAYVRLILNTDKRYTVDQILVLTFTKEATKEMKKRIRSSLLQAQEEIKNPKNSSRAFLKTFEELPLNLQSQMKSQLKQVLIQFDEAQIFTLHSFCYQMLQKYLFESDVLLEQNAHYENLPLSLVRNFLENYLYNKLDSTILLPNQVRILLKAHGPQFDDFFKVCERELLKEKEGYIEFDLRFKIEELKNALQKYSEENDLQAIEAKLLEAQTLFKKSSQKAKFKGSSVELATNLFINLFYSNSFEGALDEFLPHAELFFSHFSKDNQKKKVSSEQLLLLDFLDTFLETYKSLFLPFYDADSLFYQLMGKINKAYLRFLNEKNILTPNQILKRFLILTENKSISKKIADTYQAVVVDEFQDTDQMQWSILKNIFLENHLKTHPFFIVGDPKQSIYAFRDADIYTYLKAAKALGKESHYTLNTNYRSQPQLIEALNLLFSRNQGVWIELPKLESHLPYLPLQSRKDKEQKQLKDEKASIHWMFYEETNKKTNIPSQSYEIDYLFPFLIQEVTHLHQKGIPLSDMAFLVRDRFQAQRLKKCLYEKNISFQSVKPDELKDSFFLKYFLDIFKATLNPNHLENLNRLFLNPLFPFELDEKDTKIHLFFHQSFSRFKSVLYKEGFLSFYEKLLNWTIEGSSFISLLLKKDKGIEIYEDWNQLKEFCVDKESQGFFYEEIYQELEKMILDQKDLDAQAFKKSSSQSDAVHILSLHMSKGLEYSFVFAIGLINQSTQKERFVQRETEKGIHFVPRSFCQKSAKAQDEETNAEKLRQLYVAMTRAKERLYLPVVFSQTQEDSKKSPMDLFLEKLALDSSSLVQLIEQTETMSYQTLELNKRVDGLEKSTVPLNKPREICLEIELKKGHSFSSLQKSLPTSPTKVERLQENLEGDPSLANLPIGPDIGQIYHTILEHIDFTQEKIEIEPYLTHPKFNPWKQVIENHILQILRCPIKTSKGEFTLHSLHAHQVHKEIEFLSHYQGDQKIAECVKRGDYLHGFIDLIVEFEGLYYLIDYKTNWLGPSAEYYVDLKKALFEHHYHIQAQIYRDALRNYLSLFDKRPFESIYGGCFYWFLRALEFKDSQINGLISVEDFLLES